MGSNTIVRQLSFVCWVMVWLSAFLSWSVPAIAQTTPTTKPTTATESCVNSGCHAAVISFKVMHGPVAQNKCLDCHKYEDVSQHRFKAFVAPDKGCTLCHEMKNKVVLHAPLRDGQCMSCHAPHGSEYAKLLVADPKKGLCQICHKREDYAKKTLVHDPVRKGDCDACHESHSSAQPWLLKQSPLSLCTSCHKQTVPLPGEALSVHQPARDNCITCHDPHASNFKNQLKQAAPELCLSCHKNLKESLAMSPVIHGAMTQDGSCSNCHVSHFSKLAKLQKQRQPQQCLNCHDRALRTADGRVLTDMASLLRENPEHHGPIRLGACTACHQPHAGNLPQLLSAPYPPEFYAPFGVELYKLCFTCHTPDLALQPKNGPTGFADGEKSLHWLHVNQQKGRTCRACHEVHASQQPFHIRESVPFGPSGWPMAIRFRQTPTGGTCTPGCHVERSYNHGDRPHSIPFISLTPKAQALLTPEPPQPMPATAPVSGTDQGSYPVPKPPFTPGVFPCTGCHDPTLAVNTERRALRKPHEDIQLHHDEEHRWCLDCHNAQNRDVLRSASGEPIPFTESYRLCGQCHGIQYRDWKAGVHGKRTGEWNGRKEYLLCVNCHNPHAPKFKQLAPLPPPHRPSLVK
jgi:predicted CXXCH cytochrome family protein